MTKVGPKDGKLRLTFLLLSDLRLQVLWVHVEVSLFVLGRLALAAAETAAAAAATAREDAATKQQGLKRHRAKSSVNTWGVERYIVTSVLCTMEGVTDKSPVMQRFCE